MKKYYYLLLAIIVFSACQKKNTYHCKCRLRSTGAVVYNRDIEAKNYDDADADCNRSTTLSADCGLE